MRKFSIEWREKKVEGTVGTVMGVIGGIRIVRGKGRANGGGFRIDSSDSCRIEVTLKESDVSEGSGATVVTGATIISVKTKTNPFSFFLRDVSKQYPIFIPDYKVVVLPDGDKRSYEDVDKEISERGTLTKLQQIENEPEESYANASKHTRVLTCPTWLGLSRDMRIFEVGFRMSGKIRENVTPRFHGYPVTLPETKDKPVDYHFGIGRGWGCTNKITRHIEDGYIPILHGEIDDEDIVYKITCFVGLEKSELTLNNLKGTHYIVADGHGAGHMFTKQQEEEYNRLVDGEKHREEETVLFYRVEAVNTADVPRYAWFKAVFPWAPEKLDFTLDGKKGFGKFSSGRVYCIMMLNGKPMPQDEIAVMVNPGQKAVFQFYLPHQPISEERAETLAKQDFDKKREECRKFWLSKMKKGAQLYLPEKRIDEMSKAGLMHLDLVAYGKEPKGTLAPTIGVYNPIGSESSPIIQYFDSMGWCDVAGRAIMYFFDKQHDDGFIQNFGGYMLETGGALWNAGEHYRYTRDDKWVRNIEKKIIKACDYIIKWRERNKKSELTGKGYGMIDGKVADPEDPFHYYMLSGYAYLGMKRSAEMLEKINPMESKRILRESESFKKDIRKNMYENLGNSVVVPLGDGTWSPTLPPWAEAIGPCCFFPTKDNCDTHGTFMARDSMLGPLYLIFHEVVEPKEKVADFMVNYHADIMLQRNEAFSQPYYSRHKWINLKRGEVKAFIKAFYNGFSGLADRQTYTFWEHFFHASPHKTHEEGWFLMEIRWMLYLEEGNTLKLLPGIPRAWLENGKRIELKNVMSYFGPVTLEVSSELDRNFISAKIKVNSGRKPEIIRLRIPHPEGRKAVSVSVGEYDGNTETVTIRNFKGRAEVIVRY